MTMSQFREAALREAWLWEAALREPPGDLRREATRDKILIALTLMTTCPTDRALAGWSLFGMDHLCWLREYENRPGLMMEYLSESVLS